MNLHQMRAAALKAAQTIFDDANSAGRVMTAEEQQKFDGHIQEVKQLDNQIAAAKAAEQSLAGLTEPDGNPVVKGPNAAPQEGAKTIGQVAVKQIGDHIKSKSPGTYQTEWIGEQPDGVKANTDTINTGGYPDLVTQIDRTIVGAVRQRPTISDLLGQGTLSGSAIAYFVEGALEGAFTTVAEGGAKPQLSVANPTKVIDSLKEIAGFIKITDDMAEDLQFVVSEIDGRLRHQLLLTEEAQLLSGNGTGSNLLGILNRSGIQTETMAGTGDFAQDAIYRALAKVETGSGLSADGIVINPADYQALRLSKDSNGQYYGGGYFAGPYGNGGLIWQPPLWGIPTVVTSAVPAKTVLVGNFQVAATQYSKGGVRVESTNSHDTDFTNDLITIRMRKRVGLAVRIPTGFVKVTLV